MTTRTLDAIDRELAKQRAQLDRHEREEDVAGIEAAWARINALLDERNTAATKETAK
jgi:hypothetical protein